MSDRAFWNNVFNDSREFLITLESSTAVTKESKAIAVQLQTNWNFLTIDGKHPNTARLHQDRFDRYNDRVHSQLTRHTSMLTLVK